MLDKYFMNCALYEANKSIHPRTKVGCVVVGFDNEIITSGYNKIPDGLELNHERIHGEDNCYWFEHAERVAIYDAKKSLKNCTMYITLHPCIHCARAIIACGIKEIVVKEDGMYNERWQNHFEIAKQMFEESGISIRSCE